MKHSLLAAFLLAIPFFSFGQGHTVYSSEDPAFAFISSYMPEYYYEDYSITRRGDVELSVRVLYNYVDELTFSYFTLIYGGEWACIDIDEVDTLLNYLKRVTDKTASPSADATMVYNTRRGFKFEAKPVFSGGRSLRLFFPNNGPNCAIRNIDGLIKDLETGKQYVKYETQFVMIDNSPESDHGYYASKATVKLKSRRVIGSLPKPRAVTHQKGIVVVQISVDQYGIVIEAIPGVDGTTINDKVQWDEAQSAAFKAHFTVSANAPYVQTGTITYRFEELYEVL